MSTLSSKVKVPTTDLGMMPPKLILGTTEFSGFSYSAQARGYLQGPCQKAFTHTDATPSHVMCPPLLCTPQPI